MKKITTLALALVLCAPLTSFGQKITSTTITREKTRNISTNKWFDPRYEGELNLGFATGGKLKWADGGDKEKTNYSRPFIETVHGVRFNDYMYAGLGVSVQYALGKISPDSEESDKWNTLMIPVFLNLKGSYPVTEHFAPYLSLSFGGSFCATSSMDDSWSEDDGKVEQKLKGGFYAEYGLGFTYKRLNFGFGIQHQGLKFTESYRGDEESEKAGINSFFVKVGLKF